MNKFYIASVACLLCSFVQPLSAQESPHQELPKPPAMPKPPELPQAPQMPKADLSRSVTLTGNELSAIVRAAVLQAQAQAAAQAAEAAHEKVAAAFAPPEPAPTGDKPPQ